MKALYEPTVADLRSASAPTGQVLKGQYAGAYRSDKGKIKGLILQAGTAEYTIKLPKYLRPMLVRELMPGEFVQVWAYAEGDRWRAINILPLPACEAETLRSQWGDLAPPDSEAAATPQRLCIEVCTKGKCYRQGGQQIHSDLQAAIASDPSLAHVAVRGTGCMKACKHGPNLRLPNGRIVHQANTAAVLTHLRA